MLVSGLSSLSIQAPQTNSVAPQTNSVEKHSTSGDLAATQVLAPLETISLPTELIENTANFVPPSSLPAFSQVSKAAYGYVMARYREMLKPEFSLVTNPVRAYADPAKRKDEYVAHDRIGQQYLVSLGIGGRLTCEALKARRITIPLAHGIDTEMRSMAELFSSTGRQGDRELAEVLNHSLIIDCVIAGKVESSKSPFAQNNLSAPATVWRLNWILEGNHSILLSRIELPVVQKHLYANRLSLQDIIELSMEDLTALDGPDLVGNPDAVHLLRLSRFRQLTAGTYLSSGWTSSNRW